MRVAILGGGVSGLAAAHALKTHARVPLHITVLESSPRLGGWLSSQRVEGFLFEAGARGIRPVGRGRAALALVEQLGLQRHTLVSAPAAANRYLWHGGRLVGLPASPAAALRSELIRGVAADAVARDLRGVGRDPPHVLAGDGGEAALAPPHDESVYSFALRHFGPTAAGVLLDAALSGIYAGDVRQLSARSVLPSLWEAEYGAGGGGGGGAAGGRASASVLLALARRWASREGDAAAASELRAAAGESQFVRACRGASSVSFTGGLGMLPDALGAAVAAPPPPGGLHHVVEVVTGAAVTSLRRVGGGGTQPDGRQPLLEVRSTAADGRPRPPLVVERVISALPAPALAAALGGGGAGGGGAPAPPAVAPAVLDALRGIPFASVAAVNLGFRGARVLPPGLAGFGYLVPTGDRGWRPYAAVGGGGAPPAPAPHAAGVLGMTWDSDVFPGQAAAFVAEAAAGGLQPRRHPRSGDLLPWAAEDVPPSMAAGETRLTVMIGGASAPREAVVGAPHDALASTALRAAREHLGVLAPPHAVAVNVAVDAIPQYTLGHAARVEAVWAGVEAAFGRGAVRLVGNSFRGIGLSDAVANAVEAGASLAAELGGE